MNIQRVLRVTQFRHVVDDSGSVRFVWKYEVA